MFCADVRSKIINTLMKLVNVLMKLVILLLQLGNTFQCHIGCLME